MQDVHLSGTTTPQFAPVKEAFRTLWDDIEVGAALAIYLNDEKVVDLWGGSATPDDTKPWQADTLVNIYSSTKGATSLALAALVGDGLLDYEAPVIEYWPEFGAEQKFEITVAELLSHQAGLYQFDDPVSVEDLYNWLYRVHQLAAQKPAWNPGTAGGYHATTWGFLAGELIRRCSGKSPGTFLRDRLTTHLDADCFIGCPADRFSDCATVIGPNRARRQHKAEPRTPGKLTSNDPLIKPFTHISSDDWRRAEVPASNGHASARGLAILYAMAAGDGSFEGTELITRNAMAKATQIEVESIDLVLNQPIRRSRGFIHNCDDVYFGPVATAFGHSGAGGSIGFADPENRVGFAYVMNQLQAHKPPRSKALIDAFYECL